MNLNELIEIRDDLHQYVTPSGIKVNMVNKIIIMYIIKEISYNLLYFLDKLF